MEVTARDRTRKLATTGDTGIRQTVQEMPGSGEGGMQDCVFLIDADLQDPPELFSEMYKKWINGFKVVYGVRTARKGSFFKVFAYSIYHKIFNSLS